MPHQVHNKDQRVMYLEVYLPTAQVSYQMHLQISLALQAIHQVIVVTIRAQVNHQIIMHRAVPTVVHHPVRVRGQHPVIRRQILTPEATALPVPKLSKWRSFGL